MAKTIKVSGGWTVPAVRSKRFCFLKAISWRLIGSTDTFLIAWLISGKAALAGVVAIAEFLTKPALFYLHERFWSRVRYGLEFAHLDASAKAGAAKAHEQRRRSIIKAVCWRTIATIDTTLIAWIVTGSLSASVAIGSIELITKTIIYYYHERLWNRLSHWERLPEACRAVPSTAESPSPRPYSGVVAASPPPRQSSGVSAPVAQTATE